jgi:hypothetical protein
VSLQRIVGLAAVAVCGVGTAVAVAQDQPSGTTGPTGPYQTTEPNGTTVYHGVVLQESGPPRPFAPPVSGRVARATVNRYFDTHYPAWRHNRTRRLACTADDATRTLWWCTATWRSWGRRHQRSARVDAKRVYPQPPGVDY